MKRRDFLATATATGLLAPLMPFGPTTLAARAQGAPMTLSAGPVRQHLLPSGTQAAALLGFNGSVPGPEIRLRQGDRLAVDFENGLSVGSSVHWHGIRLPNAMDGVPDLTQDLVAPGATHPYRFDVPDAGTYWYHSHYTSHEQVALGMMGPLIVDEETPPDVDHDIVAVVADWLLEESGAMVDITPDRHSVAHAGRMGSYARAFVSRDAVRVGDRIRLRIINAAIDRIFPLEISGVEGQIAALDGMPLPVPRPIGNLMLAPAQRVDLIVDVLGPIAVNMRARQGPYLLAEIAATGDAAPRGTPIPALPANRVAPVTDPAQDLVLTMKGGAMGGRHGGDNIWSLNDVSDLQDEPFASFARGETARITLINDTSFPHGIHLHGHHFHEVAADGSLGDLRDTSFVNAGAQREIVCVFDNPGKWLLHCHMLSHQFGGMKTWVAVA